MKKQKVTQINSTAIPLQMENVDTDQIIPARFLKATTRVGFGLNVFRDWRYDPEGNPTPDFLKLLFEYVQKDHKIKIIVDVEKQTISVPSKKISETFEINPYKKICFMNGYDDINYLINLKSEIEAFEKKREN